jgi:hypothetical protein
MALLFDQFTTQEKAEAFALHVRKTYKRKASCTTLNKRQEAKAPAKILLH